MSDLPGVAEDLGTPGPVSSSLANDPMENALTPMSHETPPLQPEQVLQLRPVAALEPHDDGLRVRIADETRGLEGRHSRDLVPRVLAALDGRRSVAAVVERCNRDHEIDRDLTRACLERLYAWQIVDDAAGYRRDSQSSNAWTAAQELFLAKVSSRPRALQATLSERTVEVAGEGWGPDRLREALLRSGFSPDVQPAGAAPEIRVGWGKSLHDPFLRTLNECCVAEQRLFLPILVRADRAALGPLVVPRSACLECAVDHLGGDGGGGPAAPPSRAFASLVAQVAAIELLRFAVPALRGGLVGRQLQIGGGDWSLHEVELVRRPRCPVCGALVHHSPSVAFRSELRDELG